MPITVRDLQREQMAHAETKKLLEEAKAEIVKLKNLPAPEPKVVKEVVEVEKPYKVVEYVKVPEPYEVVKYVEVTAEPAEVIRYIRTPDLTQVTKEELRRALGDGSKAS